MPTWPATLPTEPERGNLETPPNVLTRTEMDAGPDKVRRRFTAGVRLFEVEYVFTPEEMATWETFYEDDIGDGALSFTYPDPRNWGSNITVRLRETPTYRHEGAGVQRVSMKLERLP